MLGAKAKAISLKDKSFQKYQLFLSFSAYNYETYFNYASTKVESKKKLFDDQLVIIIDL